MPIKFRCPHCRQFLGISRSKAGEIADCPMCGKRLRVPNVDGTVDPLPKPKLDLQDSSLVSALGELAGIGEDEDAVEETTGSRPASPPRRVEHPAASLAPQPIVLEPPVLPRPAVAAKHKRTRARGSSRKTTSSATRDKPTIDDPSLQLEELAALTNPRRGTSTTPVRAMPRWLPASVVLALFVVVGLGVLVMLGGSRGPEVQKTGVVRPDNLPNPSGPVVGSAPAVTGRVSYVSESGDTRADDGARVMALPDDRRGSVKLDVTGFLAGADGVDVEVAATSLRALGGDVATAGRQGEYELHLDTAGRYQLLVISRHQSRAWEAAVESDVQEVLARYFLRPSALLGQLAYEMQTFEFRGHGTSSRDVLFARE